MLSTDGPPGDAAEASDEAPSVPDNDPPRLVAAASNESSATADGTREEGDVDRGTPPVAEGAGDAEDADQDFEEGEI